MPRNESKKTAKSNGKANAATLAAAWGRKVPAALAAFLASDDLAKLEKRKITIRYAGEHECRLRFEHAAFADLAAWMEDVGLGDDIDWPNDGREGFQRSVPLAVVESEELERELLALRTDVPALPVSIMTEGTFFELWPSFDDFVGELRGTRVNPIAALEKRIAEAEKLEAKEKYAEAAALLEAALGELEPAVLRLGSDGEDVVDSAHHRAGYCRYQTGDLDAAERHYEVSAAHGGSAAAFNLVVMAVDDRKDFALAAKRVDAYWDKYGFASDASRLDTFRYRALTRAMLGELDAARAALADIERQCFARDDFGKEIGRLCEALDEAGAPPSPAGARAVAALRAEATSRLEAWRESRLPKAGQSPREWWDGLDEVSRIVLKTNLKKPEFYQVDYAAKKGEATDDELAKIVALTSFRSFTVRKKEPGKSFPRSLTLPTLAPLARLTSLVSIDLEEARGPYSLEPLAGLTKLRVLKVPSVKIDDVAPLAGLAIEELVLKATEVKDLRPLAKLPHLKRLDLWACPVEDLSPLAACTELRELVAGRTEARALPALPELTKLEVAKFHFARFSRKDVNAFQKAHPSCAVDYSAAKD